MNSRDTVTTISPRPVRVHAANVLLRENRREADGNEESDSDESENKPHTFPVFRTFPVC